MHIVSGIEGKSKCICGFSYGEDQMLWKKCQCEGKEIQIFLEKYKFPEVEETQFWKDMI